MITSVAAESQITIILPRQRYPIRTCCRWSWNRITIGCASTRAWRAVSIIATEAAQSDIISRASAGNTNCAARRRCRTGS
jgi:hypothetical protein